MSGNQQPQGQNPLAGFGFKPAPTAPSANNNQSGGFGAFSSSPSAFSAAGNSGQNNAASNSGTNAVQKNPLFGGGGFGSSQQAAPSGSSGGIFGSSSTSTGGSNLFNSNAITSSGEQPSNSFSSNPTSSGGGLFGGGTNINTNTTPNPLFGGAMKQTPTPSTQTNPLFGGGSTLGVPSQSGGSSGGPSNNQIGSNSSAQSTSAPSGGLFGGTIATGTSASTPAPSLSLFGTASSNQASSGQSTNTSASLGTTAPANTSNPLFGGASNNTSSANVSSQPSPFGAFGTKPSVPSAQADGASSTSVGGTPALPSLFGGSNVAVINKPTVSTGDSPSSGTAPLFPNLPKKPEGISALNAPSASSGFVSLTTPKDPSKEAGKDDKSATPAGGNTVNHLPGASGASTDQTKNSTASKDASSGSTPSPFAAFSLGGVKNAATSKPSDTSSITASGPGPAASTAVQSIVTSVPAPSMLRGKTVEDIVNRWTSELETHTREFSQFASEVGVWDRTLIENGNYISALYATVLAAESTQTSLDQSLDHVEQQQRHLTATLDQYEKSASEIFHGSGGIMSSTEGLGLADSERDKSYALAANLYTQLDDLSRSLTQMVESVNNLNISPGPSQSSGTADDETQEDAISTIAGILNAHLSSLQWIDGSLKEMEGKIKDAERKIKGANVRGGARSNADDGASKGRSYGLGSSRR